MCSAPTVTLFSLQYFNNDQNAFDEWVQHCACNYPPFFNAAPPFGVQDPFHWQSLCNSTVIGETKAAFWQICEVFGNFGKDIERSVIENQCFCTLGQRFSTDGLDAPTKPDPNRFGCPSYSYCPFDVKSAPDLNKFVNDTCDAQLKGAIATWTNGSHAKLCKAARQGINRNIESFNSSTMESPTLFSKDHLHSYVQSARDAWLRTLLGSFSQSIIFLEVMQMLCA
jgi:hypothetical protein